MAKSLKENYIYSLANTIAGILFPLITFPYTTRILEADGMGKVGFLSSIISYISLFTSLGIPIYAIREIAKVRDDALKVSKTTIEILLLYTILTILGYIVVAILCVTVTRISIDIPLFLILSATLFFNAIGCEWFYSGIEDFKYISIRGVIVRILYVILLFSFVHSKSDILLYACLIVFGTVGNNLFNFVRLKKYINIKFIIIKELNLSHHIKPALRLFALNLVISLYMNLDTVILGFLKNDAAVGYFTGAHKISRLVVGVIQSLQTIMVPRFSYLAKEDTLSDFYKLGQKVMDFVITISLPVSIGLAVLAPSLVTLFCGSTYEPAIVTLIIISPIVLMISLSGIPCFQILYPLGHENIAILSTATGAFANLIACFLFIPSMAHNGAALALVIGETTVTITMFLYGKKYIKLSYKSKHYLNCIIGTILMGIVIGLLQFIGMTTWLSLFVTPIVGVVIYGSYLFFMKDNMFMYISKTIINKIR